MGDQMKEEKKKMEPDRESLRPLVSGSGFFNRILIITLTTLIIAITLGYLLGVA